MARNKKQHFVPKLYMRNFTRDGQFLSVYSIEQKKTYPKASYKDQCYKNYYYGSDGIWEEKLSTLEHKWSSTFIKVLSDIEPTTDDILLIQQFAVYQLFRTVALNDYELKQKEDLICEYMKMVCNKRGLPYNETVVSLCRQRAQKGMSPAHTLYFVDEYVPFIKDLELIVIDYHSNQELITSDVPVVAINPFFPPTIGFASMGLIILFPVSAHKLVVLYDAKMYPKYRGIKHVPSTNEQEVMDLNTLQLISADRILLAKNPASFNGISDIAWKARIENRNRRVTTAFGDDNRRLIITSPRKVVYDCEFSFGQVSHRFKRIPLVCREAPSREHDSKWEEKLDLKEQLLPVFSSGKGQESECSLSNKELRRGYRQMATAAKAYWAKAI